MHTAVNGTHLEMITEKVNPTLLKQRNLLFQVRERGYLYNNNNPEAVHREYISNYTMLDTATFS